MDNNGSPSSTTSSVSSESMVALEIERPLNDEQPMLHKAPSSFLPHEHDGDSPPLETFEDVRKLFHIESVKLWSIAAPIAFNILCNYGINSFTSIFVGHIGDLELSGVAISLSVIANLSFGFLVSLDCSRHLVFPFFYFLFIRSHYFFYVQTAWHG